MPWPPLIKELSTDWQFARRLCISARELNSKMGKHNHTLMFAINNGNWTEWSAIWSEIIRVISKLNERIVRVWFEITSMIRPKLHSTQFNCHFIRSILKSHNFIALIFSFLVYCSSSQFVKKKKRNRKCLYVSFSIQNDVMWRKLIRAWPRNKQFWSQNEK